MSETSSDESSDSDSDVVSLHAKGTEEYEVEGVAEAPTYQPTSKKRTITEFLRRRRDQMIQLNVGGRKFDTSIPTLKAEPESILATLAEMDPPSKGRVHFLDRNPRYFDFVLDFLRNKEFHHKTLPSDKLALRQLYVEAEFYNLKGLKDAITRRAQSPDVPIGLWEE